MSIIMLRNIIRKEWKLFFCLLTPLILSPLIFLSDDTKKYKCLYVILLMGVGWMVEALPLPITALLPVPLFPVLGILNTGQVASNYMRSTGMMFIGAISLALGIQYSGLHKRIALKMMILIGVSPWRLLLGIMVTTFTLSSWITVNTAVTAMMIPIVSCLVETVQNVRDRDSLRVLYMLAVGYSANIGGTSVIIGSVPNLIFKDLISQASVGQDGKYTDINFATWMAFNMPIAVINLMVVGAFLGFLYLRPKKSLRSSSRSRSMSPQTELDSMSSKDLEGISREQDVCSTSKSAEKIGLTLRHRLDELGPMSFHEKGVCALFLIAILLWFTRDPQIFPGWQQFMPMPIGDASVALFVLLFMFIIPRGLDNFSKTGSATSSSDEGTLMTWTYLQNNFPWTVIFLVGGGFAISNGAQASGLSIWLGEQLNGLEYLPQPLLLLVILVLISIFTEVMSNAATISLLTPILLALSKRLHLHPLYLTFAGGIACQYAFMLPTSNPPNAIVFSAGGMQILDMVKPGVALHFLCLTVLYGMTLTWGQVIFNFGEYAYPNISSDNGTRIAVT